MVIVIKGVSEEAVASKVSQMFANLDVDGNGLISEEEFVQKCQEGEIMVLHFTHVWNNKIIKIDFFSRRKKEMKEKVHAQAYHKKAHKLHLP